MTHLRHWLILLACCLISAAGLGMLLNTAGIFIAPVASELGVGRGALAAWLTIFSVVMAAATPLAGRLWARIDARLLVTSGILLAAGAVAAMSQFTQLWQWYVAALFFGLGAALTFFVAVPTLINNWFVARRGLMLGVAMACTGLGGAIGGPIVQAVLSASGWRNAYLAVAVTSVVLAVPITLAVVRTQPADLGMTPYGATSIAPAPSPASPASQTSSPPAAADTATPTAGGPSFEMVRTSSSYWLACVGVLLFSLCGAYLTHMHGYALSIGMTAQFGALLGSALLLGNVVGKVILGVAGDRFGARTTSLVGIGLIVFGFVFLITGSALQAVLLAGGFLVGFSQSMAAVSVPMLVGDLFGQRDFPRKLSYLSGAVSLANAIGAWAVGATFDATGTYVPALVAGAVVAAAGGAFIAAAYWRRQR